MIAIVLPLATEANYQKPVVVSEVRSVVSIIVIPGFAFPSNKFPTSNILDSCLIVLCAYHDYFRNYYY